MLFEKIQLESDEKIIKIVRKHWFIAFSHGISVGIVAIAPLVGWVVAGSLMQENTAAFSIELSEYLPHFIFFYTFWLLMNWMTLAHIWTILHLDVWVVTDRRVIVIDQVSLFRRHIGSFRLEKLQDVNIEVNGIIATFLNYGVVECETASGSHTEEFRTMNLPRPRELKSTILEAADIRMKQTHVSPSDLN